MRRVLPGLLVVATLFVGCAGPDAGTNASDSSPDLESTIPSDTPSAQPSPADAWRAGLASAGEAGTVRVDAQLITDVEGFERITSGAGFVDLDSGFGDIEWTDELGVTRELITAEGHFLELDGTWFAVDRPNALPTTVAFDPLAGLDSTINVVDAGMQEVMGAQARRLDADLDPALGPQIMGFSEEELSVLGSPDDGSLIATIWIGADGRIVRLLREYRTSSVDGAPITATSVFLFDGWGVDQPLGTPVDPIPAPA